MLSVNRMNAQIKLVNIWKAINTENTPLNVKIPVLGREDRALRSGTNFMLSVNGRTKKERSSFINDGKKVWNMAPPSIKSCRSLYLAKSEIKKFVKTLPL